MQPSWISNIGLNKSKYSHRTSNRIYTFWRSDLYERNEIESSPQQKSNNFKCSDCSRQTVLPPAICVHYMYAYTPHNHFATRVVHFVPIRWQTAAKPCAAHDETDQRPGRYEVNKKKKMIYPRAKNFRNKTYKFRRKNLDIFGCTLCLYC